jgi:hypothetical protein
MNWILFFGIALFILGIVLFFQGIIGITQNKKIYFLYEYIWVFMFNKSKIVSNEQFPLNIKQRILIGMFSGLLLIYTGTSIIISPQFPIHFLYFDNVDIKKFEFSFLLFIFIFVFPIIMYIFKLMKI